MSDAVAAQEVMDDDVSASANPWLTLGCSIAVLVAVAVSYHTVQKREQQQPSNMATWAVHGCYWTTLLLLVFFLPLTASQTVFSSLTVTIIGTAFPIYESVRAVCTPEEDDDKAWLQYWIAGGVLFVATTWVDNVLSDEHKAVWHTTLTFVFLWLYFPLTDGARLLYETLTRPFLTPIVRPYARKMDSLVAALYQTLINGAHLWLLWIIFIFLPAGLKRLVAVAVGTVYPLLSSITAAATEEIEDDTYWLTYWSCYGCLFLIMDLLQTWLGWIPGFYTLVIFSTVYLMLPMFQGADKVFRKVLVPLAGLEELLLLRDAIQIKKTMFKKLDPERAKKVRKAIAKFYDNDEDEDDPTTLKNELMEGWQGIKVPWKNPFAKKKDTVDETTSLV